MSDKTIEKIIESKLEGITLEKSFAETVENIVSRPHEDIRKKLAPTNVLEPAKSDAGIDKAASNSQLLGEIIELLCQSRNHRHLFLADLDWLIAPPVALRQFRLFHDGKRPIGVALWALVSETVEKDLLAGRTRLKPAEWNSGDRIWLIECVVPSVAGDRQKLQNFINALGERAFGGSSFKIRTTDPNSGKPSFAHLEPRKGK